MLTVDRRFASWAHHDSRSPWTVAVRRTPTPPESDGRTAWTVQLWFLADGQYPAEYRTPDRSHSIYSPDRGDASSRDVLLSALSFLSADGDMYRRVMGPITPHPHEDGYLFGYPVAVWAYMESDEIACAHDEITSRNGDDA